MGLGIRAFFLALACMVLLSLSIAAAVGAATEPVSDYFVLADPATGEIEVRIWIQKERAEEFRNARAQLVIRHPDGREQEAGAIPLERTDKSDYYSIRANLDFSLSAAAWSPSSPSLYRARMTLLGANDTPIRSIEQRFGMRKLEAKGARFYVNGKPFFVRACAGEGGCGCDELSREQIRKRLEQMKNFGFNAVRHHTHVATDEYMDIADEVGIFVQMEIGGKAAIGDDPKSGRFQKAREDWARMIRMARRHPSAFIYSVGNEIYGNEAGLVECMDILYDMAKEMDPGTFVLNRSGSNPFNDTYGKFDLIERPIGEYEHTADFAREAFELYLRGPRKGRSGEFPIVAHEYPLVASYPNPELAAKYPKTPVWIQTAIDTARENGLEHLLPIFVNNTERIQAICRKEMLEEARRFRELDGYSMLRFTDCGAYVSGVVDDFADPKNVSRNEFLRTNGETVLLCGWERREYFYGETLSADIEISHHGGDPYAAPLCRWWLMNGPDVLAKGEFTNVSVDPVNVALVGKMQAVIPHLPRPAKLTLRAELPDSRPLINNDWSFWAFPGERASSDTQRAAMFWDPQGRLAGIAKSYPGIEYSSAADWTPSPDAPAKLVITDSWQESFYEYLDRGGRVWVISDKTWPWPEEVGIFGLHITRIIPERQAPPVFPELDEKLTNWLTICSNNAKREGNSGTVVYPHPALGAFPHEGFCDMQFWPLIYRAKSLRMADFPPDTGVIIRAIDNFYRGRSKAYAAELRAGGKGRLFISTLNFTESFGRSPASRYLFDQFLCYTAGNEFQPRAEITVAGLRGMIDKFAAELAVNPRPPLNEMGARYDTVWRKRLQPGELVVLPVFDADGIDKRRIAAHYEYAQTQFYYPARPGDTLSWEFENKTESTFTCALSLAGPARGVSLRLRIDESDAIEKDFAGSSGWGEFVQVEIPMQNLAKGKHTLALSVGIADTKKAADAATSGQTGEAVVYLRDVELRGAESK